MLQDDREQFRIDARRRLLVVGGVHGLLLSIIGGRLFYLQGMKGGTYRDMAENNRISLRPISPSRGRIFDRNGVILVENSPDYRLAVIPELTGGLRAQLERLKPVLDLTGQEIEAALKQARRQRGFLPVKVRAHLAWEELSRVEARINAFPGTIIQVQSLRHYPHGALAAHLLGYIGEVAENDYKAFPEVLFRSGDSVGKNGVERSFEAQMRGAEGVREVEVNALGREVRELERTPAQPGRDLYLTIDTDLQREAEEALGERAGSVVALDPRSGEVLAMVSRPAYDPNQFIRGLTRKQWRALTHHLDKPLTNKAIQGTYPPGSTFKMVTALAALHEGVVDPATTFWCGGHIEREGRRFHCWKKHGHGHMNMVQALAQSCDVYFYRVAEKMGIDPIESFARKLGLGAPTGVALDGERSGLVPSREWKRAMFNTVWFPGETLHASIGQGYLLVTPIQLAVMVAAVANGGTLYQPTLVRTQGGHAPVVRGHSALNPDHLAIVRRGLTEVLNGPHGTARYYAPKGGIIAAGKTGTAQVVHQKREESGDVIAHDDPRLQDHALFVCYAPVEAPELAISVVVEHGGHGSSTAAPVAKRVMDRYFASRRGNPGQQGGNTGAA